MTWTELLTFVVRSHWQLDRLKSVPRTHPPRSVEQLLNAVIEAHGDAITMQPDEHAGLLAGLLQWEAVQ